MIERCEYVVLYDVILLESEGNSTVYSRHFSSTSKNCSNGECSVSLSMFTSSGHYSLIFRPSNEFYQSLTTVIPTTSIGKHYFLQSSLIHWYRYI